jgi:large subunit ribosomal protein L10
MTKTRAQKKEIVEDLTDKIKKAKAILFCDYQGLKVEEITDLRKKLKKEKASFNVVKSKLAKLAFENSKSKSLKSEVLDLKGPKAIIFSSGDEVAPAKNLYLFSREHKALKILGGILDCKELSKAEVLALALLPTKPELLAKAVGSIGAPIFGFVNALAGNLRNLIYILQTITRK